MKKTILSILAIFLTVSAFADVVPASKAESVAKRFMGASTVNLVWDGNEGVQTKAASTPSFYVYDIPGGGWVIVSAEDSTTPILGYSDTGSFKTEGMPVNLASWLGNMRRDIRRAREDKLEATAEVRQLWANPVKSKTKAGSSAKYLTTPSWDQESPYNNYLSTYVKKGNNGVSGLYTGCVATAMAEVLRYHQWPEKGTGTLEGYTTSTSKYTVSSDDISTHTYDWSNMPYTYGNSATTAQKNAVAQLMVDCGIMVQMDYGTSSVGGSGAYAEDMLPALIEHMGYSKKAVFRYRTNYTTEEWMNMIAEDIDNDRPVLYGGSGDDGGHQFLCDGYDYENTMLHINWGWSGSNNGYFTLTMKVSNYTFDEGQSALFGLEPDKTGTSEYGDVELSMIYYSDSDINGVELVSGTVAKGETFSIGAGNFYNSSNIAYTGAVKVVLVGRDGNWKEDISEIMEMTDEEDTEGLPSGYFFYLPSSDPVECTITEDIALGDRIAFWYRLNDNSWAPVIIDHENLAYPWEWACVDACFIDVKTSYSSGDVFYYKLIPGNKGISGIAWSFDGTTTTDFSTKLTSGTHTVSAVVTFTDNTSETITQKLVVK